VGQAPWTRDGRVRADVVTIAPDVPALVTDVLVHDNQTAKRGDVLFHIDPDRFELALAQADAAVASRKAQGADGRSRPRCHSALNGLLLNLRASRWVKLSSNHCKCLLN
jgi:multidrug resistance efflux pump